MRLATSSRNGCRSLSTILNGTPSRATLLKVLNGEVGPFQLLLPQLGQRMQTAAEQRSHLLRGHRVADGQSVDPVQAGTDPHPRGLTPFGVIRRQPRMTLLGRIQRRHLPGQIVIPRPAVSLCTLIVTTPKRRLHAARGGHADPGYLPAVHQVCGTSDLEIGWGYVEQVEIVGNDRSSRRMGLGLSERPVSIRIGGDGEM